MMNFSAVPFKSAIQRVDSSWIDYNGHMNVTYYTLSFDKAIDQFFEKDIGIGPSYIKEEKKGSYALQTQYRYLRELCIGDSFQISIFISDYDKKRLHLMLNMLDIDSDSNIASCETILMNVNLAERKSCEYPIFAIERIKKLYELAKPLKLKTEMGHSIGLHKKTIK